MGIVGKGIGVWHGATWYLRSGPARAADTLRDSCWRRARSVGPGRAFGIRACELRAAGRSQGHNRACFRCGWPGHRTAVARVVDARCDWMEARGLPSWRGARDDLVAQRDNPEWDVWVLDDEATGVIGQTVVQRQGPSWGWTDAERAEPAL